MFSSEQHQHDEVPHSREETLDLPRGIDQPSQTGDAWAHWEYRPEEWAQFDAIDWKATRLTVVLLVGCVLLILPVLGVLLLGSSPLYSGIAFGGGFTLLMVAFGGFVFSFFSVQEGRKRHQARQSPSHRVTFSRLGVWEAGVYFPIHDGDMTLQKVSMTAQPAIMHFRRSRFINFESTPQTVTLRVLVPRGHEAEAERLRQRYQSEILDAEKEREERWKQRPEPR
jgi:hypothetical protein